MTGKVVKVYIFNDGGFSTDLTPEESILQRIGPVVAITNHSLSIIGIYFRDK